MNAWRISGRRAAAAGVPGTPFILGLALVLIPIVNAEERVPGRLSETGLYQPGRPGVVDSRNRPFSPQYPLWSDGAVKSRWVFLPPGTSLDVTNADVWRFPVGTRFWKEFSFNNRKAETRMLWKASPSRWVFASYVWNEDGTDAVLAPPAGAPAVAAIANGKQHDVPSETDCAACHGTTGPLGFNALQLSTDRDPNAIHAEPLGPDMVTLKSLLDAGVLTPSRTEWIATPPRIATGNPQTRAMLGYLAANCGSCHNGRGEIAAMGPILRQRELLTNADAVARTLVDQPTKWQVPGVPAGASVVVDPASPETSALVVRMRSRRPSSQMPPLGTVVRDQAASDAILDWIREQNSVREPRSHR